MKEITVYSNGDSHDLTTWSNVPYLFCRALEKKGIRVNRVNIAANKGLNRWFNTLFYYLFRKLLKRKSSPTFYRTWFHRALINRRLKKAAAAFPSSEMNLFLSYLFINQFSDKPNVLWCDWTDRVSIERMGRNPQWFETASLAHEDRVIAKADLLYTMFPVCKQHMEDLYGREFRYLNRNVINTVYDGEWDLKESAETRYRSNNVLFIGNHRYRAGAEKLIASCRELRKNHPDLKLHIIGMTGTELSLSDNDDWIKCHGYLRKDNASEREVYYSLLLDAKVFVNPSKQWGGYSSTVEAMFYGCPVVVSPYEDFVANFGNDIKFGMYLRDESASLTNLLEKILSLPRETYSQMAEAAHSTVADYTWDNYVTHFLADIENAMQK